MRHMIAAYVWSITCRIHEKVFVFTDMITAVTRSGHDGSDPLFRTADGVEYYIKNADAPTWMKFNGKAMNVTGAGEF